MKTKQTKSLAFPSKNFLSLMPIVLTTICTISPISANAGFFDFLTNNTNNKEASVDANPADALLLSQGSPEQAQASIEVLRSLADSMTRQISEIEPLIGTQQNSKALTLAKSVLDEVRMKSGIDPKAKLRENFLTPLVFPDQSYSMSTLPLDQQQTIIRTVQSYKGGLYLDIINLTKRVSLLYVKSLHAQFKVTGGLTNADRNKILKDLAMASIIPMPIQDKKGKIITVFDEDVANDDHIYMFNREITNYIFSAKDLSINESTFETYRSDLKKNIIGPRALIQPKKTNEPGYDAGKVKTCYERAKKFSDQSDRESYKEKCFDAFKFKKDIEVCYDLAGRFSYQSYREDGKRECIKHFGLY